MRILFSLFLLSACTLTIKDTLCIEGISEESAEIYYADDDGDGYGDTDESQHACDQPVGYVADATDCDDTDADINPVAPELCDSFDNDCDGSVDEATFQNIWHVDGDGDGHGQNDSHVFSCGQPDGYVADATDCDDGDATIYVGAPEVCDGVDNNCDGDIDEGTVWLDADADGVPTCTDCDDADADVGGPSTWYTDADGDGYVQLIDGVESCTQPDGSFSETENDCVDGDASIHPGAEEVCDDGVDNDCDHIENEDCQQ